MWGDEHTATVKIPQIVNDYNHWMLGVDVVDQLIAYYRPKICCQRIWMLFFSSMPMCSTSELVRAVQRDIARSS